MSDTPAPRLRRATPADIPALADAGVATFVETFGHLYHPDDLAAFLADTHAPERWRQRLAEPGVAVWIAEAGGTAAAYATAGPCKLPVEGLEPRAGELRQLYVRAAFQGQQLGTRLLAVALEWLASAGHAPLYVGVWSENFGAQRLYGRHGFTKVGEYDFPVGRHLDREFILKQSAPARR